MPAIRLDSRDLLEYNPRYRVLICRECQYAIQKSALRSHLLRHRIYRGERQRLMSSIAQLDLFEPHQVPLPSPASPPIDALQIISGYRCAATGCRNLCASFKRMRRHQSEIHGLSEPPNSSSFSRPVKLQTFFRGTKLRYFEVTASPAADMTRAVPLATTTKGGDSDGEDERHDEEGQQEHDGDTVTPLLPSRSSLLPMPSKSPPKSCPADPDLDTLTYFHHFITTTSLTLPGAEPTLPGTHYWQTDVVLQALHQRWLMCGLLAISACHLAALADDTTIERVHRERSAQFFSRFSAGWEERTKPDLGVVVAVVEEGAKKAGGQIRSILRCAHWVFTESTLDQGVLSEPASSSRLQSIMTIIRSFIVPDRALCPSGVWNNDDDDRQEITFAHASRVLKMRSSSGAANFDASPSGNNTLSALLNLFSALPSRMAEMFGKPESAQDVLATLSAIAALVECSDTSFASDEVGAAWCGMATWLTKVPDHFDHMVSHHDPAALVVVAHWAASLVKRAENCGSWFLRGSAKTILLRIAEQLPADDQAIRCLVGSLMYEL